MNDERDELMDLRMLEFMRDMESNYNKLYDKLDRLEAKTQKELAVPDTQECGEVVYTRLFKEDEPLLEELCNKTGRKRAQIMRILVSHGLRQGVLNEGNK